MPKPNLTSEEKIDCIFRYCRRTYHWAIFRGLVSFLFFLIFVVFPIIGGVYLFKYFKNDFDISSFSNIKSQFEEFKNFDLSKFGQILGEGNEKPAIPNR